MKNFSNSAERGCVLASQCPSRQILQHLTNRWGVLVMIVLMKGTKRFSEIRREIDGVSERMLTQTLQQLEQDGMLNRKSYNTVPPHVEYSLMDYGKEAGSRLVNLVDWLEENLEGILRSQEK